MKINSEFVKLASAPAIITFTLLLIPLTAMQFSNEVNWGPFDFIIAGILIFGTGFLYKLFSRNAGSFYYRAAIGLGLLTSLMLIWANMAVGLLGSENDPENILYGVVLAIGFAGTIISRLKAEGMSKTLFAMAAAHFLVPVFAYFIFKPEGAAFNEYMTSWHETGVRGVVGVSAFFAVLFTGSALLFRLSLKVNPPVKNQQKN